MVSSLGMIGLAPSALAGQVVAGHVLEAAGERPIGSAIVDLIAGPTGDRVVATGTTDDSGHFTLRAPGGQYRLRARRIGYSVATAVLDLLEAQTLRVDVRLSRVAVPVEPVTIVGRENEQRDARLAAWGYYDRKHAYGRGGLGFGHFLEGESLGPTAFTAGDVLREVPGMRVSGAGGWKVSLTCRSGRTPRLYVDGAPARYDLDEIPMADVVAMEVYPGNTTPAEYNGDPCVIAIWTGVRRTP